MIFITVGAYDLPFDRMVKAIDSLIEKKVLIREEVVFQIGHSIEPGQDIKFERFLGFDEMNYYANKANLIITQGGPGSIMLALSRGKVPIVVPRQKKFGEMVDNHQVLFTKKMEKEKKILAIYDTLLLEDSVKRYDDKVKNMNVSKSNIAERNKMFVQHLEVEINSLFSSA